MFYRIDHCASVRVAPLTRFLNGLNKVGPFLSPLGNNGSLVGKAHWLGTVLKTLFPVNAIPLHSIGSPMFPHLCLCINKNDSAMNYN